ncbi:hypothetical protein [Mycolicibacterium bacteremicum]|uniref:Uncharacterized protein n=1 Tax=Mycolicibacterium bacteremicum TaxID=564198 RepID=A0A1W9YQ24_MYCBA|nr:hypothetical protein [Mycolicibacterium bacteremicum]MCV7434885.1 hypothetical protein [Mycolicibacterium bacteremicum]ORA02178.1 hypothetical protein BST17_25060 [Mycolicibacterium bacteremicum]
MHIGIVAKRTDKMDCPAELSVDNSVVRAGTDWKCYDEIGVRVVISREMRRIRRREPDLVARSG